MQWVAVCDTRPMSRRPRYPTPSELSVSRALNTLLEGYYPPPREVHAHPGVFTRRQDDTDGERGPEQELSVRFTVDGDAWVLLADRSLRFRKPEGGGMSPRVQRALVVLAEAIRRDNEEHPQGE